MLPTFQNGHFVMVCTEKMMDYQYKENGARNIYSSYNQMRAYVECFPNQSKELHLIDLSDEILKSPDLSVTWLLPLINMQKLHI